MNIRDLYLYLESFYPKELSCEWDHDGLQVCACSTDLVKKVLISLDITEDVIEYAIQNAYNVILSHHPFLFDSLDELSGNTKKSELTLKLLKNHISTISFHTRADAQENGVSDLLAKKLNLKEIQVVGEERILRVGYLNEVTDAKSFAIQVKNLLGSPVVHFANAKKPISKIAVSGGEGKDFINLAIESECDAYLCGKMGYHAMQTGAENGISLFEAGHFFSEKIILARFQELLPKDIPSKILEIPPIETL